MNFERRAESGVTVLGICARVSNERPELIGDLWRRLHASGDHRSVAARLNDAIYCVYCEYEGDFTQPYTTVLGCAVAEDAVVPEGMKKVTIGAGEFAVFPVETGQPLPAFQTWTGIWQMPLERRYQADYDLYAEDGSITIHVGVQ